MKEVVIATQNKGKAKDFESMLSPLGFKVLTLTDLDPSLDIEETGSTFEENARIKAEAVSKKYNRMVIADDSGLEIDALGGKPGVFSARYAGEEKDDTANMDKVLSELITLSPEERTAQFSCALAVAIPGKKTMTVVGICKGQISEEKKGKNGFGYDPIFYVPSLNKTLAELSPSEKSEISHRGHALSLLEKQAPQIFS
jgi:XTP/dITP diphosphohydrolase